MAHTTKLVKPGCNGLMDTLKSGLATNPIDGDALQEGNCCPLINIISGVVLPHPVAACLALLKKNGEEQVKSFFSKRFDTHETSFWDNLPHVNLKTFTSVAKKKTIKSAKD